MSFALPSPGYHSTMSEGGGTQFPGVGVGEGNGVGVGVGVGIGVGVGVGVGEHTKTGDGGAVSLILKTKASTKKLASLGVLSKAPIVVGKQVELVTPVT